jgi:hypothetical protein
MDDFFSETANNKGSTLSPASPVRETRHSQMRAFALLAVFVASSCAADPNLVFNRESGAFFDRSVDTAAKPIANAWATLRRDWYKTIGTVVVQQASPPSAPAAPGAGSWLQFYIDASLPAESFTVKATTEGSHSYLAVTGADVRGLIYGVYHVSGDVLGVDPYWWFLDLQPAYAGAITVPATYSYWSGPPTYRSRGAFINDEDISGYFFTDAVGDSVYSADAAARYAETLLRLRVNTIIPSTYGYVDERHYRVYAERGLILGNHHVSECGEEGRPTWRNQSGQGASPCCVVRDRPTRLVWPESRRHALPLPPYQRRPQCRWASTATRGRRAYPTRTASTRSR